MDAMEKSCDLEGREKTGWAGYKHKSRQNRLRNCHIGSDPLSQSKRHPEWQNQFNRKPPCACYYKAVLGTMEYGHVKNFNKRDMVNGGSRLEDKQLCFRCVAGDHRQTITESYMKVCLLLTRKEQVVLQCEL